MRAALEEVENEYRGLLCYGCVAHLLDLLCEDFGKILKPIIDDVEFVINFVLSHERLKSLFLRLKGAHGRGLRSFPDSRFGYAYEMIESLSLNMTILKMLLDPAHATEWKQATTNKNKKPIAQLARFRALVGNVDFSDVLTCVLEVLRPVASALRFVEGDSVSLSFFYPLFLAIVADLEVWDSTPIDEYLLPRYPRSGRALTVQGELRIALENRWKGSGKLVALFHPVHLFAYLLNPYMCPAKSVLPAEALNCVNKIVSKFCVTAAEITEVTQAFLAFHTVSSEEWTAARAHASDASAKKTKNLLDSHLESLSKQESELSNTETMIIKCRAAGNAVDLWTSVASDSSHKNIALRVLSSAPTSCSVERMNSIHKRVISKGRAALKHERIVKLMFCYVNLRLLNGVSDDVTVMVEDALLEALDALELEGAEVGGGDGDGGQGDGGQTDGADKLGAPTPEVEGPIVIQ